METCASSTDGNPTQQSAIVSPERSVSVFITHSRRSRPPSAVATSTTTALTSSLSGTCLASTQRHACGMTDACVRHPRSTTPPTPTLKPFYIYRPRTSPPSAGSPKWTGAPARPCPAPWPAVRWPAAPPRSRGGPHPVRWFRGSSSWGWAGGGTDERMRCYSYFCCFHDGSRSSSSSADSSVNARGRTSSPKM